MTMVGVFISVITPTVDMRAAATLDFGFTTTDKTALVSTLNYFYSSFVLRQIAAIYI